MQKKLSKLHNFSKEHIDKFNNNINISTKTSIKNRFVDLIYDFHIIDKDVFYGDLYFKDKVKNMILDNTDKDKTYEIASYKFNQILLKNDAIRYWIEKYNINNINEIDNIENLVLKRKIKDLKPLNTRQEIGYDIISYQGIANGLENINFLADDNSYDKSIATNIQNTKFIVKISKCSLFQAGNSEEIAKIPEMSF